MASSAKLWSFLLLLSLVCSVSDAARVDPGYESSARFPQGQAERMIKALNLLPGVSDESASGELLEGPKLQERRINLDIGGDAGVTTEELGQYAGYFKLARTHAAQMFYFFFESRGNKTDDPVVLWMTGGPGCASELALFYENGPFKITDNLTLVWNDYGWDKVSSIIFVDQPVGTGFSYSTDVRDIRHDERGVGEDMYDFFQAFFAAHPEYAKNKFYVTGESYAGHYVPAVASRLHKALKEKEGVPINLKGFAIGNGLTQPDIQYAAYADYALDMNLITAVDHERLSKLYPACAASIKLCGPKGTIGCIAALIICQSIFSSILALAGNINYYDVRKECEGALCYDFSNLDTFLNNETTREALGVGHRKFVACSPLVYEAMVVDWMRNLEKGIPELLEDGIELLVYAGEFDLICNWLEPERGPDFLQPFLTSPGFPATIPHVFVPVSAVSFFNPRVLKLREGNAALEAYGNSRWVTAMEWSGQMEYVKATWKEFEVDGVEAGLTRGYGPLQFLKVHDAGHMVPMDQPKNSLEMLYRWTRGISLSDKPSNASILEETPSRGDSRIESA